MLNEYQHDILIALSNLIDQHKEGPIKVDYGLDVIGEGVEEELILTPILYIDNKRRTSTIIRVAKDQMFGGDSDIVKTIEEELKNMHRIPSDFVLY